MRGTAIGLTGAQRAALGVRDHVFEHGDRQALRDAGAFVDALIFTREERDILDDLADEIGTLDLTGDVRVVQASCSVIAMPCSTVSRIMRANLAADAVFQRRDDLAARRVVLGIGGEHQQDVERKPDGIAFDLNIAFLHDVEQADLNLAGKIGKFVDGEDAAIRSRQQTVMDGQSRR